MFTAKTAEQRTAIIAAVRKYTKAKLYANACSANTIANVNERCIYKNTLRFYNTYLTATQLKALNASIAQYNVVAKQYKNAQNNWYSLGTCKVLQIYNVAQ